VLATLILRPERGCTDHAAFVADVTIPDNTAIPSGTNFVKTWRLKNVGTCTWTKQYTVVVHGKSEGTQSDWVSIQEDVPPQQTVDVSIELPAPSAQGIARWEAILQNELGDWFGLGSEPHPNLSGKPFWVQINVVP
jgi:acetone carboxylase gamma subunit